MADLPQSGIWGANTIYWGYGGPEPMGPYPKPDINICAPANQPITALLAGTVTSVQYPHFGGEIGSQPSVTVLLDNPPNASALYSAYNYLGSTSVNVGQRIHVGDVIGTAKGQGVCTAFALTNKSPYGTGDFSGNPNLDATSIVLAAISGKTASGFATLATGSNVPLFGPLIDWLNQFSALAAWIKNPLRIFKLVMGILLLAAAIVLLLAPEAEKVVSKATGVIEKAAVLGA